MDFTGLFEKVIKVLFSCIISHIWNKNLKQRLVSSFGPLIKKRNILLFLLISIINNFKLIFGLWESLRSIIIISIHLFLINCVFYFLRCFILSLLFFIFLIGFLDFLFHLFDSFFRGCLVFFFFFKFLLLFVRFAVFSRIPPF